MSIYHKSQPTAQNLFRENTAAQTKMLNVTTPHFTCSCCQKHRPTLGRKRVNPARHKDGYLCADCQTVRMDGYNGHRAPGRDYSVALRDMLKVAIMNTALTAHQISSKCQRSHSTVITVVKKLHAEGLIHVEEWTRQPGRSGPMEARYRWGEGDDAEKPEPVAQPRRQPVRNLPHHAVVLKRDPLMSMLYGRV